MVAHPAHRHAAVVGRDFDLHGQLRYRVGALPVSLNDVRAAQHPRRCDRAGFAAGIGSRYNLDFIPASLLAVACWRCFLSS